MRRQIGTAEQATHPNSHEQLVRVTKLRAVLAMTAICLLSVLAYLTYHQQVQTDWNGSKLINLCGRQRLLLSRSSFLSEKYINEKMKPLKPR